MPNEYARWGDPNNIGQQMTDFTLNHFTFQTQLYLRTEQVRNHIQSNFELPNQVDLTLNVFPQGAGSIHISTITPEMYPWEGVYFNGVPIRIEAIAADGFSFLHWDDNGLITDTLSPIYYNALNTEAVSFNAYFEPLITSSGTINSTSSDITAFPNPARDQLILNHIDNITDAGFEFQTVDIQGRIIKQGVISFSMGKSVIDIRSIPPSLYILRLLGHKNTVEALRFVKTGN